MPLCWARCVCAPANKTSVVFIFLHGVQNALHECAKYEDIIKNVNTLTQAFPYQGKPNPDLRRIMQRAHCFTQHKAWPCQHCDNTDFFSLFLLLFCVTIACTLQALLQHSAVSMPVSGSQLWNSAFDSISQEELAVPWPAPRTPPPRLLSSPPPQLQRKGDCT